jgi:hypothetical protein
LDNPAVAWFLSGSFWVSWGLDLSAGTLLDWFYWFSWLRLAGSLGASDLLVKLLLLWLRKPKLLKLLKSGLFWALIPCSVIVLTLRSARLLFSIFFGKSALAGSLPLLILFSMVSFRSLWRLPLFLSFSSSGLF